MKKVIISFVLSIFLMSHFAYAKSWSDVYDISDTDNVYISDVHVLSNDDDMAMVFWQEWDPSIGEFNIKYKIYNEGSWSDVGYIDDELNTNTPDEPKGAMNENGDIVVAWTQSDGVSNRLYVNKYTEGSWSGAQAIDDASNYYDVEDYLDIDINDSGIIVVAWSQSDGVHNRLYSRLFREDAWGSIATLDTVSGNVTHIVANVNRYGSSLVSWRQSDGTGYNVYTSSYSFIYDTWSTALEMDLVSNTNPVMYPKSDINDNDKAMLVWQQSDGTSDRIYAKYYNGSSWGSVPIALDDTANTNDADYPSLSLNNNNRALVAWVQLPVAGSETQIFVSNYSSSWSAAEGISRRLSENLVFNAVDFGS